MKLILKERYIGKQIVFNKKKLNIDDIPRTSYEYYYTNGLADLFILEDKKKDKSTNNDQNTEGRV